MDYSAIKGLDDIDLDRKRVFLRLDLNVPIQDGKITDTTRIDKALPTIRYILEHTSKLVIASHLGRPTADDKSQFSLSPVGLYISGQINKEILLVEGYEQEPADQLLNRMGKDQVLLLENLRFHAGEKANDKDFAEKLGKSIDVYINDAFGAVHRKHASIVGLPALLPKEQRAAGFLLKKEINALGNLESNIEFPYGVVLGGAKVSDKIEVILNLINHCNHLFIGGAMAYTFLAFKGTAVGKSIVQKEQYDLVNRIYQNAERRKVEIHLPQDHLCAEEFSETAEPVYVSEAEIPENLMGLDIGPKTIQHYKTILDTCKTVLWNGPQGVFEWENYKKGTEAIAQALGNHKGYCVVGGGDSVAAVVQAGVADRITHVSTGGGASLKFLEDGVLPGLKALM